MEAEQLEVAQDSKLEIMSSEEKRGRVLRNGSKRGEVIRSAGVVEEVVDGPCGVSVDVDTCSRCGGRMKLVEIANDRDDIARVLALHSLVPDPPVEAGPMPAGQMALAFA